jgi:hypothetical protein
VASHVLDACFIGGSCSTAPAARASARLAAWSRRPSRPSTSRASPAGATPDSGVVALTVIVLTVGGLLGALRRL